MTPQAGQVATQRLVGRVLNAMPAGGYEMHAFLSLLSVEATADVPTASVSCERRPVLRLNPAFVARHCRTDEHLFLLVMHELHHVLLGHTRLFPRFTPAHNVAFDAVINALLCLRFPQAAYTSFFLDLYGERRDVLRLLAPPRAGGTTGVAALDRLHALLYAPESAVTSEEVFARIVEGCGGVSADLVGDLLGSHAEDDDGLWGTGGPADADVVAAIRRLVEKWPPPAHRRAGRDIGDQIAEKRIDVVSMLPARVRAAVHRSLTGAAVVSGRTRVPAEAHVAARMPVPDWRDRKACTLLALGTPPLLFDTAVASRTGRARESAEVYVDVSGSMDGYLPVLCAALRAHRDLVTDQVHLFSTKVVTVPLAQVVRGVAASTEGTDIACVLDHVLERRSRKVLVVTDGYVGQPGRRARGRLRQRRCDVRVLLTPDGWRSDLAPIASRIDTLPPLTA